MMNLVCFSHLRWNFVYQRPQHLLSRFAKNYTVYYVEEAEFSAEADGYSAHLNNDNVTVIVPHINHDGSRDDVNLRLIQIINLFFAEKQIQEFMAWYYTPMALNFTAHLKPQYVVFDCMDELSAFKFAPQELKDLEAALINKADIIFTGGNALYEAKKNLHHNIFSFPSSIDKNHFGSARSFENDADDQRYIPHPRLGFYGVIDERFDIDLIEKAATAQPDWQFILIGPIVKIDEATLPRNSNIHYLGSKSYNDLPLYLGMWDIALIPFAINESTKFISPTKTPEYLAAGKPVISSAITDVIHPYAIENLVHIYTNAEEFIALAAAELANKNKTQWLAKVDAFLANISWDDTCNEMMELIETDFTNKQIITKNNKHHV